MEIIGLYIDGYKNIRNTYLDLAAQPLLAVLAPNNYGKTNLIEGIRDAFLLLKVTEADLFNYLTTKMFPFVAKIDGLNYIDFIFRVEFIVPGEKEMPTKEYHYEMKIKPHLKSIKKDDTDDGCKIVCSVEIKEELLKCWEVQEETNGDIKYRRVSDEMILFNREKENPDRVTLFSSDNEITVRKRLPKRECEYEKNCALGDDCKYPTYSYLFLESLAKLPVYDDDTSVFGPYRDTLQEITEVWSLLTSGEFGVNIYSGNKITDFGNKKALLSRVPMLINSGKFEEFARRFQKIMRYYKVEWTGTDVLFLDTRRKKVDGDYIREELDTLSFGTVRIFKILSQVMTNDAPLITIEEFETGLNPSIYRGFVIELLDCLKDQPTQRVIFSTHSPGIVDSFTELLEALYLGLPSAGMAGEAKFRRLSKAGHTEINELVKHPDNKDYLRAGTYVFSLLLEEGSDILENEGYYEKIKGDESYSANG